MPARDVAAVELAELLAALAHPHRIRLIEELRSGEVDVHHLVVALGLPQTRVSQHLAVLRAHRIVVDRREGRHVFYHLADPALAGWLTQGLDWISAVLTTDADVRAAVNEARSLWSTDHEPPR